MMKNRKVFPLVFLLAFFLAACVDDASVADPAVRPALSRLEFDGFHEVSVDSLKRIIRIAPDKDWRDSLEVVSAETVGGASLFLAEDSDLISPEIGERLVVGAKIPIRDTTNFSLVVLDSANLVVAVWRVVWEFPKSSSAGESSDSRETGESSSSGEVLSSSGIAESESSSSAENVPVSSSAGEAFLFSSSSEEANPGSSDSRVRISSLFVEGGTVSAEGSKIYVELPYPSDLSRVKLEPLDSLFDLRREVEMEFLDSNGTANRYKVIAGMQLPGSDFDTRNDFWATTSDAMETDGKASVIGTPYTFKSSPNLEVNGSALTLSTKEVVCAWTGIPGGWKMASGFYFAGTYSGKDARDVYVRGYEGGTPFTGVSDISLDMTFGKPFSGRPSAFELSYSYVHAPNKNAEFPQKSLAYAILVSADGKAVALGMISDSATVERTTKIVALSYGADPDGLLAGDYPGTSDLALGTGTEDVAEIRVLFASSAYAHRVAGGAAGNSKNYRGGENSSLTLENLRLIY